MGFINEPYLPESIRAIHIALMNEFKDISVRRFDKSGNLVKTIRVPIVMAIQEKYQALIKEQEGQKYYLSYPKMSLTWNSTTYNGERARGVNVERLWGDPNISDSEATEFVKDRNPVPYDFGFDLDIQTESLSDFTQILESILPFFDPSRHLRVKEFRFLNIERNMKIRLEGISQDFLVEQEESVRRYVNGTLSMSVEGFMYTPFPLNTSGTIDYGSTKIIKQINTRYYPTYVDVNGSLSTVSASGGYNTSGWDSSASFPSPYDTSGVYREGEDDSFEYYIDDMFN